MSRSFKIFIVGVLIVLASLVPYFLAQSEAHGRTVIRAAIDIGSGSTKLRVAEVDLERNTVVKMLVNEQFTVMYMRDLEEPPKGEFSEAIMAEGVDAIARAKKMAMEHGAEKVIALATAAFRKASNGEELVQRIQRETGVPVFIVDQALEGELAFKAALTQIYIPPQNLVVFDIGGGSMQLTSVGEDGNFVIYRGHEAVEPFKNYVIEKVQNLSLDEKKTPNPLSTQEIEKASVHYFEVAERVDEIFKQKFASEGTRVVGVGSVFSYGILPVVGGKNPFTALDLTNAIVEMTGKTDEELGGEEFVEVKLTNAILIRSVMQALNITEIKVVDVNNADGAFFYEAFWTP